MTLRVLTFAGTCLLLCTAHLLSPMLPEAQACRALAPRAITVVQQFPAPDAANQPINTPIGITWRFDEQGERSRTGDPRPSPLPQIYLTLTNLDTGSVVMDGRAEPATQRLNVAQRDFRVVLAQALEPNSTYRVDFGMGIGETQSWTFTTSGTPGAPVMFEEFAGIEGLGLAEVSTYDVACRPPADQNDCGGCFQQNHSPGLAIGVTFTPTALTAEERATTRYMLYTHETISAEGDFAKYVDISIVDTRPHTARVVLPPTTPMQGELCFSLRAARQVAEGIKQGPATSPLCIMASERITEPIMMYPSDTIIPDEESEAEEEKAEGCMSAPLPTTPLGPAGWMLILSGVVLALRRRRV